MVLWLYKLNGNYWGGQGCSNNYVAEAYYPLDDALEPYTFQAIYWGQAAVSACSSQPAFYLTNLRDKNGNFALATGSCFNSRKDVAPGQCGRFNGTSGLTIVKHSRILLPNEITKYACVNGVCALAQQGIYDTVEQCQATGCQAPGSPEKPLSELCPEGESCGQNSTCVTNQDLNNWIQAINDMKTVIQG